MGKQKVYMALTDNAFPTVPLDAIAYAQILKENSLSPFRTVYRPLRVFFLFILRNYGVGGWFEECLPFLLSSICRSNVRTVHHQIAYYFHVTSLHAYPYICFVFFRLFPFGI